MSGKRTQVESTCFGMQAARKTLVKAWLKQIVFEEQLLFG